MQAVILAAGSGTRMAPLSDAVPKPLLPVADRPLVLHTIDAAIDAGAVELVIVVGRDDSPIRERVGDGRRGVPIEYVIQGTPAGTADAVAMARPRIDGSFAVLNGDNLYGADDLDRLFNDAPSVGMHRVDDPTEYGVLSVKGGEVVDIVEKPADPPSDLANAGAYAFPESALEWLDVPTSPRGERELTDVLRRVINQRAVTPVPFDRWLDIGRPWELLAANELLLPEVESSRAGEVRSGAELEGTVAVEAGAVIESGAVVDGPVVIRRGARVGPNAYVRGSTYVGRDARIGHGVEIKNSVMLDDTAVGHLSYVGDSLLGPATNLGAGTMVANLRHDDEPVRHTVKGRRVSTGRRKFGIVTGEHVKTGINTSVNPGVTLSSRARTVPGEVVERDR